MLKKSFKLDNNTNVFYRRNENTPRIALCFNIKINKPETIPGVEDLMTRLFLQGTKTRTAEQLAEELDAYAIEFTSEARPDYIRLKFVCLNEDFSKAVEIMEDVVKNSTFEDFAKELQKMEGEIIAELDSPRIKAVDNYYGTLFENHPYGNTGSKILANIKNITKEEIRKTYSAFLNDSKKIIALVGDIDIDKAQNEINRAFGNLPASNETVITSAKPVLHENKYKEILKSDVNQAHIIKGWLTETSYENDYPALLLLNIIMGASGLSSRLFLELRDKKGLAYVVRSCYETFMQCADFYIYIATEPKNIEVSLKGFEEEINKIITIPVRREELDNARNNLLGKWAFSQETNSNQAILYANYGIMGLGFDFNDKAKEAIKNVTPEQLQECAGKCFGGYSATSILKP